MARQIRIEKILNGYIISTGEYKKSSYKTLSETLEVVKKLFEDEEAHEKERRKQYNERKIAKNTVDI